MASNVSAGTLTLDFNANDANLTKAIANAEKQIQTMERGFKRFQNFFRNATTDVSEKFNQFSVTFASLSVAVTDLIVNPLKSALSSFAEMGYGLETMARKAKLSTETLGAIGYAAEQSGAKTKNVAGAFTALADKMDLARRGNADAMMAIYRASGLTYAELRKLDPKEQFLKITDAINQVQLQADRAKLVERMFGSDALLPMIEKGRGEIERLMGEGGELGGTWSQENVENSKKLANAMNRIKTVLTGLKDSFLSDMADSIAALLEKSEKVILRLREFVNTHKTLVKALAIGSALLIGITTSVGILSTSLSMFGALLTPLLSVLGAFLSPWIAIPTLIAGATAAFLKCTDTGRSFLSFLTEMCGAGWETVSTFFTNIKNGLSAFFGDALKLILQGDFSAAFRNLWKKTELYFLEGQKWLEKTWISIYENVTSNATGACKNVIDWWHALGDEIGAEQGSIADMVLTVWYAIQKGLLQVWYGIEDAWHTVTAGLKKTWIDYNTWWEKTMNNIMGKIYNVDKATVDSMNRAADQQNDAAKKTVDTQRNEAITANEKEREIAINSLQTRFKEKTDQAAQERNARQSEREKRIEELKLEIAKDKEKLQEVDVSPYEQQVQDAGYIPGGGGQTPLFMQQYQQGQSLVTRSSFQAADGGGESSVARQIRISEAQLTTLNQIMEALSGV